MEKQGTLDCGREAPIDGLLFIVLLLGMMMLSGCVTLPAARGPTFQKLANLPADKGVIYIYRPSKWVNSGVMVCVKANGKTVARLPNRSYSMYLSNPGNLVLKSMDVGSNCSYPFLRIHVEPGQVYYVKHSVREISALAVPLPGFILVTAWETKAGALSLETEENGEREISCLRLMTVEETPLYTAARSGDKEEVERLLGERLLAHKGKVDEGTNYKETPLHAAAENGHKEVAQLLTAKGADVNARDALRVTPLHLAAANGHKDIVEFLLSKNAKISSSLHFKLTPLHYAAENSTKEMVEFLLSKGLDIEARDAFGRTPLVCAVENGNRGVAELLIAKVPKTESNLPLLHVAVMYGQKDMAEFLVKHGFDVKEKDASGKTPLDYATSLGDEELVKFLSRQSAMK